MKNKNIALVAVLFITSVFITFAENGPTPQVIVGSSGISDGSVTNAKLAEPISVANGGTGKTTAAEALSALGGASLNGSSTVAFNALTINGVAPLTAAEKTQALVGSSTVDFLAQKVTAGSTTATDTNRIVNYGFSQLGELGTGVKMKIVTGTTSATVGGTTSVAHGLNRDKIVGFFAQVQATSGTLILPSNTVAANSLYIAYIGGTNVYISLADGASSAILGCAWKVIIFYAE